jgi:hypothetical protein
LDRRSRRVQRGKRGRVGIKESITSTHNQRNTQDDSKVLAREEATRKDNNRTASPEVPALNNSATCTASPFDTTIVVDLYLAGHPQTLKTQLESGESVPFMHQIILHGPQGELIRVKALFDDGAMVGVMCASIFNQIKHRLHNWTTSSKNLRMANGNIVKSIAKWSGTVEINSIKAQCSFEVFDSAGSWGFLFGKPMLKAFKAIHDYTSDTVKIFDNQHSTTIKNQIIRISDIEYAEQGISLTLDPKQREIVMGGMEKPPSRQVKRNNDSMTEGNANINHEHQKHPTWQPMGQWTPKCMNQQVRKRREQRIWRQVAKKESAECEHSVGSEELPSREVSYRPSRCLENPKIDRTILVPRSPQIQKIEPPDQKRTQDQAVEIKRDNIRGSLWGSEMLPSREVMPITSLSKKPVIDQHVERSNQACPIRVIIETDEDQLLGELPEPAQMQQNPSIYTRKTNAFNPARVVEITRQIMFGEDLTREERKELEEFVANNADSFALSLGEVIPIPGAAINLNVPENTAFNLRIHQRPLTTEQSKFYDA